jgi:DNA invertase Pin-like site-specific DNA recombinase
LIASAAIPRPRGGSRAGQGDPLDRRAVGKEAPAMADKTPTLDPVLTTRTISLPARTGRSAVRSLERAGLRPAHVVDLTVAGESPPTVRRAAQYVRMSTEHQHYSIGYQCTAIGEYARQRGLAVVRTYSDEARSGLTIGERPALRALLADVVGQTADFEVILVYDVSRWGRFQDSDESAYYEYLCRREGLEVHYCAEPFRNDGTAVSSLIKNVKRMMAGEYSRELSEKIFAAKCQAVRMGRSAGSPAIYGYRRMLVDSSGRERHALAPGELKSIRSDRIVLVPGPAEEVGAVRWIFRQVADHATPLVDLAADLNRRGIPWRPGKPWQSARIQLLLANEKYIGNTVYNRASMRLKRPRVNNPPEE